MKKLFTNLKVFMTLLLLCGVSSVWGVEWSHTFVSPEKIGSDNSITVNGVTWTFTNGGKQGSPTYGAEKAYSNYGLKFGSSGSNYFKSVTFTTSYFNDKKVTSVKCNILNNGKQTGTLSATQGGVNIGSVSKEFSSSWNDMVISANQGNGGDLAITYSVAQAFYIHSITVTYENKSSEAFKVTFNPGTNGICATESLTETSASAGVTLPACTANDGFVFKGWADEGGNVVGQAGETYKPGSNCTLYAVYTKTYVLTITQPADGGTLTVKNGETELETGATVEVGTNLTCEVTGIPEGKRFSRFYAEWGENKYKQTNPATFENLTKDVLPADISALEVYVTYQDIAKYTINYMVNGINTNPQKNVYEGTALVFPTVGELGGKVFVGWSEIEVPETDTKPTLVETTGLKASTNATYYAVFAQKVGDDFYKLVTTLAANKKYLFVSSNETGSAYALNASAIGTTSSATSPAGNVTISLDGSDKIITAINTNFEFKYNSDGDVDLVCSTSGEKLVINGDGFRKATSNYKAYWNDEKGLYGTNSKGTTNYYVNYNSSSSAFKATSSASSRVYAYEKSEAKCSSYCTTVIPLTQDVTISNAGWATACLPFNATITSDNATAYYVTDTNGDALTKVDASVIPAGEGVLLKSDNGGEATVTFTESAEQADDASLNMMIGSLTGETFEEDGFKYYILANGGNGLGFYYQGAENDGSTVTCAAGKAVLAVPTGAGIKSFFSLDDETTSIHDSQFIIHNSENDVMYNLNGQVVGKDYKGIVIVNGKKMLNK